MLYIPMFAARLHINRMRNLIENYTMARFQTICRLSELVGTISIEIDLQSTHMDYLYTINARRQSTTKSGKARNIDQEEAAWAAGVYEGKDVRGQIARIG